VVFGGPGVGAGGSLDLSSLNGANGFVLNGIDAGDNSGVSVSSAGDVNGDGVDDVIIGATRTGRARPARATWSSAAPGVGAGGSLDLSSLERGQRLRAQRDRRGRRSGGSVSSAGT
jgi:hypothetical protein